jgi:hypothetical protein
VELVLILDRKFKVLKKKYIGPLKVQWTYYGSKDETLEHEDTMWEEYPQFVSNFEENRS